MPIVFSCSHLLHQVSQEASERGRSLSQKALLVQVETQSFPFHKEIEAWPTRGHTRGGVFVEKLLIYGSSPKTHNLHLANFMKSHKAQQILTFPSLSPQNSTFSRILQNLLSRASVEAENDLHGCELRVAAKVDSSGSCPPIRNCIGDVSAQALPSFDRYLHYSYNLFAAVDDSQPYQKQR